MPLTFLKMNLCSLIKLLLVYLSMCLYSFFNFLSSKYGVKIEYLNFLSNEYLTLK